MVYIDRAMGIMDFLEGVLNLIPNVIKFFKNRWSRWKLDRRSRILYGELKSLVYDIQDYFGDKTVSFSYILKHLGAPHQSNTVIASKGDFFRQLEKRAAILDSWYFSYMREMKSDARSINATVFVQKVYALSSFVMSCEHYLVWDLNQFLREINNQLPDFHEDDYGSLRGGYNHFLDRYESFLKKVGREVGHSFGCEHFNRLK